MNITMRYYPNGPFLGTYQACGNGEYSGFYGHALTEKRAIKKLKKAINKAKITTYPKEMEVSLETN